MGFPDVQYALTDQLIKQRLLQAKEGAYQLTRKGEKWFFRMGIDTKELLTARRAFARPCLDWSERRHHLGGALGAALLEKMIALTWLKKGRDSRVMYVTDKGQKAFYSELKLSL